MAKNEAKIKFTAETGEFNEAIRKSNDEMSELRAEMKLNKAQMDNTGESADLLKRKHELLQKELKAAGEKSEALAKKLETAEKYFGGNSNEASKLRTQLANAKTAEAKLEKAVRDCAQELDDFDTKARNAGKGAREAGDGAAAAASAIGNFASDALQAGIDKVVDFVEYLSGLPEETREARRGMAILKTSFDEAGLSADQGKELVRNLYGVLGDNDKANEAATLIAKMADSQEDLNDWTTIATGIFGSYGESLPVESLAEAANETSKTGTVTGTLADALNWSSEAATMFAQYMGKDVTTAEDAFNVALSKCSTEQERQQLITETLTTLYGDAAGKYRDAAGGMIEANTASYDLQQTEAQLGETIEPVTTAWDGMKNELLTATIPAVEAISGKLTDAFNWLKEHPAVLTALTAAFATFGVGLGIVAIAWGIYTAAQWAANSAMLPFVAGAIAVIAIISGLVAAGVWLYQNWDVVSAWAKEKWGAIKESVSTAVESAKTAVLNAWESVKTWTSEKFEAVKSKATEIWSGIKTSISDTVTGIKTKISSVFTSIRVKVANTWNGIKRAISTPIEAAKNKVKSVIDSIKGFFDFDFQWPHIPLPHFGISPPGWQIGDLLKGSIPSLGIEWYAEGGIMTKPTAFGMNGNSLMVGGEAGPEAILPIDRLEEYISDAMERKMGALNLQSLARSIEDLADRPIQLNINGRQFALATAGAGDSVNGLRTTFKRRGLALD